MRSPSNMNSPFICGYCDRKFSRKHRLSRHVQILHLKLKLPTRKTPSSKCDLCGVCFSTKHNLRKHIAKAHVHNDTQNDISCLTFISLSDFEIWKEEEQSRTVSKFVIRSGYGWRSGARTKVVTFYCHRSDVYKPKKKTNQRSLKSKGSSKTGKPCSAFMSVTIFNSNGRVEVKYCNIHSNHEREICFQPLPKNIVEFIVDKLKQGVPASTIISQLYDDYEKKGLEVKHSVTKRQIRNIAIRHNLINSIRLRDVDALNVELIFKQYEENSSNCPNPFIYYKKPGVEDHNGKLNANDFMLVVMTESQKDAIKLFGNEIILVDATRRTNTFNFNVTTIVVINDLKESYPVAFCVSARIDKTIMSVFFSKVFEAVGMIVTPRAFISDDANVYWNSWIAVANTEHMPEYRLLCKWQVVQNWKKNLKKIDCKKTRAHVKNNLDVLIDIVDITEFEYFLLGFLQLLQENNLDEFRNYFCSMYEPRKQMWATSYRQKITINTNMVIEAFHKKLKHCFDALENKRVDVLINCLLEMTRDKNFDHLLKVYDDGKLTRCISNINHSHRLAVTLMENDVKVEQETNTSWNVESTSGNKRHLVARNDEQCNCKVICEECHICMHMFTCTCYDFTVTNNMCKHIHLIQLINTMQHSVMYTSLPEFNIETDYSYDDAICNKISKKQNLKLSSSRLLLIKKIRMIYNQLCDSDVKLDKATLSSINSSLDDVLVYLQKYKATSYV